MRGCPEWRVQTDSLEIANKLRKNSKARQIGRGEDKAGSVWLFRMKFSRRTNAVRYLKKLDSKGCNEVRD